MRVLTSIVTLLTMLVLAGCELGPNSGRGFSLPEGDAERGKAVFLELACNQCHYVDDIKLLESHNADFKGLKLGGTVHSAKTYGDLITSIINPSHKISSRYKSELVTNPDGTSMMMLYNDVMTVSQLVDLVTFLEQNYKLEPYNKTNYYTFGPIH